MSELRTCERCGAAACRDERYCKACQLEHDLGDPGARAGGAVVAGERIWPGDAVFIGPDGRAYLAKPGARIAPTTIIGQWDGVPLAPRDDAPPAPIIAPIIAPRLD